ncbi:hypothetical protein Tco_0810418 [Tanacetum coccineum]
MVHQKEETFQVIIDFWYTIKKFIDYEFLLANKKCIVNAEFFRKILDICPRVECKEFTEHFWYTSRRSKTQKNLGIFHFANKKCIVDAEVFRKILDICPRVEGEEFTEVQDNEATLTFLIDLGYKGPLHKYTSKYVDHMHHSMENSGSHYQQVSLWDDCNDRLRKSRINILMEKKSRRETMPFPRFTKVIINHFLSQHKSLSKLKFQHYHTIKDDGIVNKLKFVRIREDYQEYGLPIPDMMLNDKIKQSESYQMFLKYSTGLIPPKKIDVSDESEPEPTKKKTGSRSTRGVVIQDTPSAQKPKPTASKLKLMGVQSLTPEEQEATYTRQALKESKKTSRRQPGTRGSSEETGRIPGVPDESTVVSATLSEGTSTKPGVPDEEKVTSEENVILEWGSEHESKNSEDSQLNFNEEEKKDNDGDAGDEDEDNDHVSDSQDTDIEDAETEYDEDEIYKYKIQVNKDVDVEMKEAETVERKNKEKVKMTDATKADVEKTAKEKGDAELVGNAMASNYQVKESTEFPLASSSLSVSSGFGTHFLNLSSDASLTGVLKDSIEEEISSLMDVHIQQETPQIHSPSVLKVPVSLIPETTTLPPIQEIPTETLVSIALSPPQVTPTISIMQQTTTTIPTPPITTDALTITTNVPESNALSAVQLRVVKLEKDMPKLKKIDHSIEALATLKSQVPTVVEHYLGSKIGDDLQKIQTPIVDPEQESEKSASEIRKSFNRNPVNHALYYDLIEALIADENAMDMGVSDTVKDHKRRHDDDKDDDEDPLC